MISECSISVVLVGFLPFRSSLPAKFFSISLQKSSTKQNSFVISSMGNLIYFFITAEFTLFSCLFYSPLIQNSRLKRTFMLHGNNKIRKLIVQYGGVDRYYLFTCGLFATFFTSCMIIHVSSIYKLSNYEIPICVFAILFFTYRALEAAFFAKTKEPSPEFAEVITEKVVNNVGLNAEDNSQEIGNALA